MRIKPKVALYAFEILLGLVIAGWWFLAHRDGAQGTEPAPVASVHDPELGPQLPPQTYVRPLPVLPDEQQELHGTFIDKPFWLRLLSADANGLRRLELVYTPPSRDQLDNAMLSDCPFLQLDAHAAIVAWDGRSHLSGISRDDQKNSYRVVRELQEGEGDGAKTDAKLRTLTIEPIWDLRLAPVLLALSWKHESSARIRLMDFFGPRIQEELYLEWTDIAVTLAGESYSIVADGEGRFERLQDSAGQAVLHIQGRP